MAALAVLVACLVSPALDAGAGESPAASSRLTPMIDEPDPVELAPYMGELQRLTHKLSLSVGSENPRLASFYAYEALEVLRKIQREVPEYDGQPVAVLIDRLALPPLEALLVVLGKAEPAQESKPLRTALDGVIESCNACHRATLHDFIKITNELDSNPFNQDFGP